MLVDHINQQKDDNRFENLRLLDYRANRVNSKSLGFSFNKNHSNRFKPYRVNVKKKGKRIVDKHYACPLLARFGYIDAIKEHHGISIALGACF